MHSDSLWLAMDLSSPSPTMALWDPSARRALAEVDLPPSAPSEQCLPALARLLDTAGRALGDVTRYLVPSGPGSFTGLRIGLATAKAFAMALDRPIDTLSGAEARARAWAAANPSRAARVVTASQVATGEYARCVLHERRYVGETTVPLEKLLAGEDGATLLLDEKMAAPAGVASERFPLRATHLAAALPEAATRRTYADFAGWVDATPSYFGGDRFK